MWIDTQADSERVPELLSCPSWQCDLFLWSISTEFPLASHYDLLGSQPIFGASQESPVCAYTSLSQDGSYQKVEHPLT